MRVLLAADRFPSVTERCVIRFYRGRDVFAAGQNEMDIGDDDG